jgi:F1F0 ATPase subunit 2
MSETLNVSGAILGGFALGVFFFAGLWWTVRRGVVSAHPAVVFLTSMLVRTAIVLLGFYFLGRGDWRNVTGSLTGFVVARFIVTRNVPSLTHAKVDLHVEGAP